MGAPVSVHVGVPPAQAIVPLWQALAGVQAVPEAQATHAPVLQTMPVPQPWPSGALPDSIQSALPVLHVVIPTRHGVVTAHDWPTVHATHVPCPHTMPVPHGVPSVKGVVWSTHTGAPAHVSLPA